ncbi:hypothetical protein [Streptomyces sp. NPDC037389]
MTTWLTSWGEKVPAKEMAGNIVTSRTAEIAEMREMPGTSSS